MSKGCMLPNSNEFNIWYEGYLRSCDFQSYKRMSDGKNMVTRQHVVMCCFILVGFSVVQVPSSTQSQAVTVSAHRCRSTNCQPNACMSHHCNECDIRSVSITFSAITISKPAKPRSTPSSW